MMKPYIQVLLQIKSDVYWSTMPKNHKPNTHVCANR
ncbi:UNVERIFIED_CONTAM: hypothetical protein GTU68_022339 [Idotea baltica]|nr:hypothetical protein [Idotea baltica]